MSYFRFSFILADVGDFIDKSIVLFKLSFIMTRAGNLDVNLVVTLSIFHNEKVGKVLFYKAK